MKKYILVMVICTCSLLSQAQAFKHVPFGIDSVKLMMRFDSAVKSTPDFGYTVADSAILMMALLSQEDLLKLMESFKEEFEKNDPYKHISAHLEGGWEVAAQSESEGYYLIKQLRGDKYWVKQLARNSRDEYYKSSLTLFKIDCREGMLGVVQSTDYDQKGTVINSTSARDDIIVSMDYAVPDTVGEALVEAACK